MILYFSGTGNSAYVARQIAAKIDDEALDLFDRIQQKDYSELHSDRALVFVYPTYGWQMPRMLEDWIMKTSFSGNKEAYFVTTCGSSKGAPENCLKELCSMKNFKYRGCAGVKMPENYIAMFPVPDEKESKRIIFEAKEPISRIIKSIRTDENLKQERITPIDTFCSTAVNSIFYKLFVKSKGFKVEGQCISCGKCEKVCPLNNVKLVNGRPVWGKKCTHCMACICKCPTEAIEYGRISKGKTRYQCPVK